MSNNNQSMQYEIEYYVHNIDETQFNNYNLRCTLSNNKPVFDISDCYGRWQYYESYNKTWINNTNIIATACQNICVNGNDLPYRDGVYVYHHFDHVQRSNVYYCKECTHNDDKGHYLHGYLQDRGNYSVYNWFISKDYTSGSDAHENIHERWNGCFVNTSDWFGYDWIFKLDHCRGPECWQTKDEIFGWDRDWDMTSKNCDYDELAKGQCVQLKTNSQIRKTYNIKPKYQNLAVGMDTNIASLNDKDMFKVEYKCSEDWEVLISSFIYTFQLLHTSLSNIIYSLPASCNNISQILIQFSMYGASNSTVYIDDVFLYYDVDNILFKTYNQTIISNQRIINSVKIVNNYKYKDFNLKWAIRSSDLISMHNYTFKVEIQCDNNYFYVNDLCIIKEYNSNNTNYNCVNGTCNDESYKLPLECDFATEILIAFDFASDTPNSTIYIDHVYLYHSDSSGNTSPLCRTSSPTESPTKAPTLYSPIDKTDSKDIFSLTHLILIFLGISLCICIILMIAIRYIRRLMQRKEMVIEKAMVILIAIGVYDDESDDPDPILQDCDLTNLHVENDITNIREVFGCQGFKYTIFPQKTDFEIEWKKQDIIELLNEKAKQFHVESNDYDSLIVAISGHGYDNNICTSDYKLINKVEIEHIFTNEYLESINKPRLFLFDCCDGAKQRENWSDSEESEDTDNQNKNVSNPQQKREKQKKQETKIGKTTALIQEENEEKYNGKLLVSSSNSFKKDLCQNQVEIHAANKGYQAKLDMVTGSYMIYNFCKKLTEDLEIMGQGTKGKKSRYIYEIFDQISDELEIAGKQKIVPTYNNETRYIRFKINTPTELVSDEIEMAETMIKSDSEVSEQ
eukprot:169630_1